MWIVAELFLLALCAACWAPDTRTGKFLRTILIDAPADAFSRATPLKVIVWLCVFAIVAAFVIAAPEWIAMFGFGDFVAYVDVGVILLLLSAVERSKLPLVRAVRLARHIGAHHIARRIRGRRARRLPRPGEFEDAAHRRRWPCRLGLGFRVAKMLAQPPAHVKSQRQRGRPFL